MTKHKEKIYKYFLSDVIQNSSSTGLEVPLSDRKTKHGFNRRLFDPVETATKSLVSRLMAGERVDFSSLDCISQSVFKKSIRIKKDLKRFEKASLLEEIRFYSCALFRSSQVYSTINKLRGRKEVDLRLICDNLKALVDFISKQ